MTETEVVATLREQFPDMATQTAEGNWFFFVPAETERLFPFATLMVNDLNDSAPNLSRPGVYRLNIGVGNVRLREPLDETGTSDFTALDTLMPHPTYASAGWVCILNPGVATFGAVKLLLAGAYERSEKRVTKTGRPAQSSIES